MTQIHFVNKERTNLRRVPETTEYESGVWAVTLEDAQKLVGGMIYLHQKKSAPAFFGGRVCSFRDVTTESGAVHYIFRIAALAEAKDVSWQRSERDRAWTSGILDLPAA